MSYINFFKLLGNPNPICVRKNKIPVSLSEIEKYNGVNDLYFYPNQGGTKNKEINKFNCFFVDIDCGRDKNGKYFSLTIVERFKKEKIKQIENFCVKPNAITETRNGFQCMWFLRDKITYDEWVTIENALVKYFGGDENARSPANQMRIPNTYWCKEGYPKFFCKIVELNDVYTYIASYRQMLTWIKKQNPESKKENQKSDFAGNKTQKQAKRKKTEFFSCQEMYDYIIKDVDMFAYLQKHYNLKDGSPSGFCCILHKDENPSASIFTTDNGIQLYCCHSDNCAFDKGNLIQLIAYKEKCNRSTALRILRDKLNLKFSVNQELFTLIFDNIQSLKLDIKESHKELHAVSYRYIPTLEKLYFIAFENLYHIHSGNKILFSASTEYIAKCLNRDDKKKTGADISFLCLLGLIEKVDIDSDIPEEYKEYIRHFQGNRSRHINVYALSEYTYEKLNECNEMAKKVKEKNLRKRDFTYESVKNAFDVETANRVFPQIKNKAVKDVDTFLVAAIQHLLEENGYFTQNTVYDYYRRNDKYFKENQYIKQLPAIMQQLNLEKVKASKKIKEQYGILSAGFPYLFRKKS